MTDTLLRNRLGFGGKRDSGPTTSHLTLRTYRSASALSLGSLHLRVVCDRQKNTCTQGNKRRDLLKRKIQSVHFPLSPLSTPFPARPKHRAMSKDSQTLQLNRLSTRYPDCQSNLSHCQYMGLLSFWVYLLTARLPCIPFRPSSTHSFTGALTWSLIRLTP